MGDRLRGSNSDVMRGLGRRPMREGLKRLLGDGMARRPADVGWGFLYGDFRLVFLLDTFLDDEIVIKLSSFPSSRFLYHDLRCELVIKCYIY